MHCQRCQGLLIAVDMRDMGQSLVAGWRCLICGAMTDPGIEANRAGHELPIRNRARVPGSPVMRLVKGGVR